MHCPVCGINIPKFLITVVVGFIFIFATDYVIHNNLLMGLYEQTMDLWRPPESMQDFFPFMIGRQVLLVALITIIFALFVKSKCPVKSGLYGLFVGTLVGINAAASYIWMPIPAELALFWLAGYMVQGLGLGILCGLIYKDSTKCCDKKKEEKEK